MSIKERFRRALRKSDSSSSLSHSDTNTTTTTTTNNSQSSLPALAQQKPPAINLSKTFTWGSSREKDSEKEREKKERRERKKRSNSKPMHPSEKPLTAQNLRHQEMLGQFTMTFGATKAEENTGLGGVSPCCTRPASIVDSDEFGP